MCSWRLLPPLDEHLLPTPISQAHAGSPGSEIMCPRRPAPPHLLSARWVAWVRDHVPPRCPAEAVGAAHPGAGCGQTTLVRVKTAIFQTYGTDLPPTDSVGGKSLRTFTMDRYGSILIFWLFWLAPTPRPLPSPHPPEFCPASPTPRLLRPWPSLAQPAPCRPPPASASTPVPGRPPSLACPIQPALSTGAYFQLGPPHHTIRRAGPRYNVRAHSLELNLLSASPSTPHPLPFYYYKS